MIHKNNFNPKQSQSDPDRSTDQSQKRGEPFEHPKLKYLQINNYFHQQPIHDAQANQEKDIPRKQKQRQRQRQRQRQAR